MLLVMVDLALYWRNWRRERIAASPGRRHRGEVRGMPFLTPRRNDAEISRVRGVEGAGDSPPIALLPDHLL